MLHRIKHHAKRYKHHIAISTLIIILGLWAFFYINSGCGNPTGGGADGGGVSSWQVVGNPGFSSAQADHLSLFIYDGIPYVGYVDFPDNPDIYTGEATVMRFEAGSGKWVPVGDPGFSAGEADNTTLFIASPEGTPYVAYRDGEYGDRATVMKFNGITWEIVGCPGFSEGQANGPSLFVALDGTPYVAYSDYAHSPRITVMKFNSSLDTWEAVGSPGFSLGVATAASLFISSEGTPYVAYSDHSNNDKVTVERYNGSSWVSVGSLNFSEGQALYVSLFIATPECTPYVAYRDNAHGTKITVMKYISSLDTWEVVGTPGFSGQAVWGASLFVDNYTPYVAFKDYDNGIKLTVMKFNGTNWETVGNPGFSSGIPGYISLFVYYGIPYVAYQDTDDNWKVTVVKYE